MFLSKFYLKMAKTEKWIEIEYPNKKKRIIEDSKENAIYLLNEGLEYLVATANRDLFMQHIPYYNKIVKNPPKIFSILHAYIRDRAKKELPEIQFDYAQPINRPEDQIEIGGQFVYYNKLYETDYKKANPDDVKIQIKKQDEENGIKHEIRNVRSSLKGIGINSEDDLMKRATAILTWHTHPTLGSFSNVDFLGMLKFKKHSYKWFGEQACYSILYVPCVDQFQWVETRRSKFPKISNYLADTTFAHKLVEYLDKRVPDVTFKSKTYPA